jgi:putative tricarboxylic transport membrane protein
MIGDRIFGLVMIFVALGYILSATGIQTSFMSDPVGPRAFPYMIAGVTILCGLSMIFKPDPDVTWPTGGTLVNLILALVVLIVYALSIRPLGFIAPTCIASAILAWQISRRPVPSVLAGLGLGIGLFVVFKFVLGLGLFAFPRGWF